MISKPYRGDIFFVNLDPTVGHEQAKKRPCLVVSHNIFNQGPSGLVVVLPITSKYKKLSWLVEVALTNGKLQKTSYVLCNQIRTVSLFRFSGSRLGEASEKTIEKIEGRLRVLLEL